MEIEIGSIIKIICSNNLVEAGKLIEYTEDQMVLELFDKSIFIVQNPLNNIVAIKINLVKEEPSKVFIEEDPEPDQHYKSEELRVKNLAELHKLKADEERRRASFLLHKQKNSDVLKEVPFGYPSFAKPVPKHPKKKT